MAGVEGLAFIDQSPKVPGYTILGMPVQVPDTKKTPSTTCVVGEVLAGVEGLEPPTPGFGDLCSSQLSYTPLMHW